MEIEYKTKNIEEICTDPKASKRKLGKMISLRLFAVVNFIETAENIVDLMNMPSLKFHDLKGNYKNTFSIYLGKNLGWRLLIKVLDSDGNVCENNDVFGERGITLRIVFIEEVSNHYE